MVQIRTPQRIRILALDVRWLVVMGLGLLVSLVYYAALIWAGVWVVRVAIGLIAGS